MKHNTEVFLFCLIIGITFLTGVKFKQIDSQRYLTVPVGCRVLTTESDNLTATKGYAYFLTLNCDEDYHR